MGYRALGGRGEGTPQVIDFCGLTRFDDVDGQPETEIGCRFARTHWGHGYATLSSSFTESEG